MLVALLAAGALAAPFDAALVEEGMRFTHPTGFETIACTAVFADGLAAERYCTHAVRSDDGTLVVAYLLQPGAALDAHHESMFIAGAANLAGLSTVSDWKTLEPRLGKLTPDQARDWFDADWGGHYAGPAPAWASGAQKLVMLGAHRPGVGDGYLIVLGPADIRATTLPSSVLHSLRF
jgi:hypothetical protein